MPSTPGSLSSPNAALAFCSFGSFCQHTEGRKKTQDTKGGKKHTAINILVSSTPDGAAPADLDALGAEVSALSAEAAGRIHGALQRVALPAKDVVAVLAETGRVARREDERLRAVGGPLVAVVELRSVPDNLVHELRDLDRVARRAGAAGAQEVGRAVGGIGNLRWRG